MNLKRIGGVAAIGLAFSLPAFGQGGSDRPFTATGNTCSTVTWSQDALQKYPTIGAACQDVMQRDGKSYVKFTGEVVGVADGGRKLTIDFKGGGVFTVSAPENMNVSINKQRTRVRDLRRGDRIAQLIVQAVSQVQFHEVEHLPGSVRSIGGFGSTGVHAEDCAGNADHTVDAPEGRPSS